MHYTYSQMLGRTADILEAVIDGFIDTGEPVSSGWVYKHHDFGIKPAMIRWELDGLSRSGFLEQPHHSAGRIPSDRGYEFFAERALLRKEGSLGADWAFNLFRRCAWENLAEELSDQLGLAALVKERKEIYKTGIDELVENLDWDEPSEIKTAIRDFVGLEEKLSIMARRLFENAPRVFIGKKSPVTRSGGLAVVGGMYQSEDGEVLLLVIGPKRMDYKKTIKIFKNLDGRTRK